MGVCSKNLDTLFEDPGHRLAGEYFEIGFLRRAPSLDSPPDQVQFVLRQVGLRSERREGARCIPGKHKCNGPRRNVFLERWSSARLARKE